MLYLLGGAPRCGKSLLARRINRERGLPVVSTDLLRGVLIPLLPALKEAMDARDVEREADLFYPHLRQAALVLDLQVRDALIEGVGFLPRHVVALRDRVPMEIRACFLGRSSATVADLFAHPTEHRIYERLSDDERQHVARRVVAWSLMVAQECAELGLPFIDLARTGFEAGLRLAGEQLREGTAAG